MKWNERDFQEYRNNVCNVICDMWFSLSCEGCTKTGEEIKFCYKECE